MAGRRLKSCCGRRPAWRGSPRHRREQRSLGDRGRLRRAAPRGWCAPPLRASRPRDAVQDDHRRAARLPARADRASRKAIAPPRPRRAHRLLGGGAAQPRRASCCAARPTSSVDDDCHPAYMRILDALAPDEARILRFLGSRGPAARGRRAGRPARSPPRWSRQGCTMIGEEAGCRHARPRPRLPQQPATGSASSGSRASRCEDAAPLPGARGPARGDRRAGAGGRTARTVRRSIVLTPFGEDFCASACRWSSRIEYSVPFD